MGMDTRWLSTGMMVISPFLAPMFTLDWLVEYHPGDRWKFWLFATAWCLLAWAFATAMFWAALKSFDHCLGRMPETKSQTIRRS